MKDEITAALERRVIELDERVIALEGWKADTLNRVINVMMTPPSKAERGQYGGDASNKWTLNSEQEKKIQDAEEWFKRKEMEAAIRRKSHAVQFMEETHGQEIAAMIEAEPTPEELEYLKRVASDPPIPYPPKEWYNEAVQPDIDWEKVARARLTSLKWEALPEHWQHGEIEAAKAAIAEYLRQVKEGGE